MCHLRELKLQRFTVHVFEPMPVLEHTETHKHSPLVALPSSQRRKRTRVDSHSQQEGILRGAAMAKGYTPKNIPPRTARSLRRARVYLKGKGKMARLLKKAGDFVLDVAAQQYKRSMTRKLNAFGEQAGMKELGVLGVVVRDLHARSHSYSPAFACRACGSSGCAQTPPMSLMTHCTSKAVGGCL